MVLRDDRRHNSELHDIDKDQLGYLLLHNSGCQSLVIVSPENKQCTVLNNADYWKTMLHSAIVSILII